MELASKTVTLRTSSSAIARSTVWSSMGSESTSSSGRRSSGLDEARPHRDARKLDGALATELRVNADTMGLDRLRADRQAGRRFPRGDARGEQPKDLPLARSQSVEPTRAVAGRFPHRAHDGA